MHDVEVWKIREAGKGLKSVEKRSRIIVATEVLSHVFHPSVASGETSFEAVQVLKNFRF